MGSLAKKNPVAFQVEALLFLLHKHLKNQHFPLSLGPKFPAVSIHRSSVFGASHLMGRQKVSTDRENVFIDPAPSQKLDCTPGTEQRETAQAGLQSSANAPQQHSRAAAVRCRQPQREGLNAGRAPHFGMPSKSTAECRGEDRLLS